MRSSSLPSLMRSIKSSRCLLGRAASPYLEAAMRSTTANTMCQRILATQKRIRHTRLCNLDTTPDLFRGAKNRETLNQVLTTTGAWRRRVSWHRSNCNWQIASVLEALTQIIASDAGVLRTRTR